MGQVLWKAVPGKELVSEVEPGLRLTVTKVGTLASVRFVVEEHGTRDGAGRPLLSGYRESVAAAMTAAEEGAIRIGRN